MNTITTYISHPSWAAISALALGLVIYFGRPKDTAPIDDNGLLSRLHDTLGLPVPKFATALLAVIWTGLFLIFLSGIVWAVLDALTRLPSAITTTGIADLRWSLLTVTAVTAALGAVVALPFTVARTTHSGRRTRTAEQGHITDQINTAVQGLGAVKDITRQRKTKAGLDLFENDDKGKPDFKKPIFETVSTPNIEVRIGAIYALERIAQDSPRDHVQIMEILCAYVRENAPANGAEEPSPDWIAAADDGGARYSDINSLANWVRKLNSRTDIQTAVRVLGRRTETQRAFERADSRYGVGGYRLDLRGTNLQGVDVSGLEFGRAMMQEARMEGADLSGARMEGANLMRARMEGANLAGVRTEGADLSHARMDGANLWGARMKDVDLIGASMEEASLWQARMEGANLMRARLQGADLSEARMEGAKLHGTPAAGCQSGRSTDRGGRYLLCSDR